MRGLLRVPINLADFAETVDDASMKASHYLDLETGKMYLLDGESRRKYEALLEAIGEFGAETRPPLTTLARSSRIA